MQAFCIRGGNALRGELTIHGAKNSALPVLAACLLPPAGCTIENVPQIDDVSCAMEILRQQGCRASWQNGAVFVDARQAAGGPIPASLAGRMRSSVLFFGSQLARFGEAVAAAPGGCALGPRPIDLHLRALRDIGARLESMAGQVRCILPRTAGGTAVLPYPSVGATENLMLAACGCGPVTIQNAAREPEIVDLGRFLTSIGMQVEGAGTGTVSLRRPKDLHAAQFCVMPDRIETATYLCAAAATGGELLLRGCAPQTLLPVLEALQTAGCTLRLEPERIALRAPARLRGVGTVVTAPYPGFPTDAQPPLLAAMACAAGESRFVETVFSGRFGHAGALRRMGAQLALTGQTATLTGVSRLHGAQVEAKDLRGGAALVVAALAAEGESRITGLRHLRRGYMDLEPFLKNLGADIKILEFS